jgi:hypothetical protein
VNIVVPHHPIGLERVIPLTTVGVDWSLFAVFQTFGYVDCLRGNISASAPTASVDHCLTAPIVLATLSLIDDLAPQNVGDDDCSWLPPILRCDTVASRRLSVTHGRAYDLHP